MHRVPAKYRGLCTGLLLGGLLLAIHASEGASQADTGSQSRRPITVADIIGWSRLAGKGYGDVGVTSSNGVEVASVVERGDVARNVVRSTVVVVHLPGSKGLPAVDTVATFVSASNRPAVSGLRWLADNRTLAVLGERADQGDTLPQVYAVDIRSRQSTQLTHHPTPITGFDLGSGGYPVVYMAERTVDTTQYRTWRQHGFAVQETQSLYSIAAGQYAARDWVNEVFVIAGPVAPARRLRMPGREAFSLCSPALSLSPDGTTVLLTCSPRHLPEAWAGYKDPVVQGWVRNPEGQAHGQYYSLNVATGVFRALLAGPSMYTEYTGPAIPWAPTGHTVALGNVFLPLDVADPAEREWRRHQTAVVAVDAQTGALSIVSRRQPLLVKRWLGPDTLEVTPGGGVIGSDSADARGSTPLRLSRTQGGWREAGPASLLNAGPEIVVEQDMNTPPRLVLVSRPSGERRVIYEPEPGLLQRYTFAEERLIHWRSPRGLRWQGGLFIPPHYDPHRRYPLVVQTHDFSPTTWDPDGPYSTSYAAQALASMGIMVLQIGDDNVDSVSDTPREAPITVEAIEGAIDSLDRAGVIDRMHVGIQGFSRTGYPVLYMLTHSRHPIAAAVASDGDDMSYVSYVAYWGYPTGGHVMHTLFGGPPWGARFQTWREQTPGFNLDRVQTPLRLEAANAYNIAIFWEEYQGLLQQHKPVEYFLIPDGTHVLIKPWERLASQGGAADWFRFWLTGEEDPDPAKAEQYARWRELRKLQEQQHVRASVTPTALPSQTAER